MLRDCQTPSQLWIALCNQRRPLCPDLGSSQAVQASAAHGDNRKTSCTRADIISLETGYESRFFSGREAGGGEVRAGGGEVVGRPGSRHSDSVPRPEVENFHLKPSPSCIHYERAIPVSEHSKDDTDKRQATVL
ncbi:hypothetical protein E2C01_006913 [Portunus trituberculatus]|uniref:Uncharacterized protein n=1 Tax=Portunus trituberculatus TaxID=210409 RepID=A0A5B7D0Z6_PORTR|nr:hypothetical protein [Portunus trituberculatus]